MKKIGICLLLLLLTTMAGWAQDTETLQPAGGVSVGKVKYFRAATQRNEMLEKAITRAFEIAPETEVRYLYNHVPLAKDTETYLVLLPGREFSGSGGSSAALFTRVTKWDYRLVTRFSVVRSPILVAPSSSNGWHDLVIRTSGGGMAPQFSLLEFDGNAYPSNPTSVEALPAGSVVNGTAYLANPLGPDVGLTFTAPEI